MSNVTLTATSEVFVLLNGFNAEQRERVFTKVGVAAVEATQQGRPFDSAAVLVEAVAAVNRKRHEVYLSINADGKVEARVTGGGEFNPRHVVINTYDEFIDLCNEDVASSILCSSSLDFPREYTKSRKVIALCDQIRNA